MVGNKWPTQSQAELRKFFGDPDANNDGVQDPKWVAANLTTIVPPYPMFFAGKPLSKITCHKKVAESLARILRRIATEMTPAEIKRYGLDQYGGVNNFRAKRGNPDDLSTHAYAIAIDLAVALNPWKVKYGSRPNMMPLKVVRFFQEEGWDWGGLWRSGDAMHFQAARTGSGQDLSKAREYTAPPKGGSSGTRPKPSVEAEDLHDGKVHEALRAIQQRLDDLGYREVGSIDGRWGNRTQTAVMAFRNENGLPIVPKITEDFLSALPLASPRKIATERATATASDLREKGSLTIKAADALAVGATTIGAGGAVLGGAEAVEQADPLGSKLGVLKQIVDIIDPIKDFVAANAWWILPAVAVAAIWYVRRIINVRVDDHRTGKNLGL